MDDLVEPGDYIVSPSTSQRIIDGDSINDVPTYQQNPGRGRVNQQQILPGSVNARSLGNVISSQSDQAQSTTKTIGNGETAVYTFTAQDSQGRAINANPDVSIFVGMPNIANQWPFGAFSMVTLPVAVMNDQLSSNSSTVNTRVVITNNTGSTQTVIVTCQFRLITNAEAQLPQLGV